MDAGGAIVEQLLQDPANAGMPDHARPVLHDCDGQQADDAPGIEHLEKTILYARVLDLRAAMAGRTGTRFAGFDPAVQKRLRRHGFDMIYFSFGVGYHLRHQFRQLQGLLPAETVRLCQRIERAAIFFFQNIGDFCQVLQKAVFGIIIIRFGWVHVHEVRATFRFAEDQGGAWPENTHHHGLVSRRHGQVVGLAQL